MIAALALTIMAIPQAQDLYAFRMKDIDGKPQLLSQYVGKVVMVVNVASECGLTPQYQQLQELYVRNKDKGFVVLGFPCNDFGQQEPGTEADIKKFCTANYKVTFPMFSKIHVKGPEQASLYKWLVGETGGKDIEWNFAKFLIGRDGKIISRFATKMKPDAPEVTSAVANALARD